MVLRAPALAAAVALLSLAGCVGPARTLDAYEADVVATVEEVASAASTALLAVDASQAGRMTANYLTVVLAEAEGAGSSAQSQLESVQPPGKAADDLLASISPALDETTSVLADLRVAVRRSQLALLPHIAAPLDRLISRLERFATEHER